MDIKINIIAAVADNLAIGNKGRLLWHISEDLKYFKKVTMGCPVIMGRKTFESLGRPLPGRLNIVVTRNAEAQFPDGVVKAGSFEEAVEAARRSVEKRENEVTEEKSRSEKTAGEYSTEQTESNVFVIGGGEIYRQTIRIADRLYITHVHASPAADTFFPKIEEHIWIEKIRGETAHDLVSGLDYEFIVYERVRGQFFD